MPSTAFTIAPERSLRCSGKCTLRSRTSSSGAMSGNLRDAVGMPAGAEVIVADRLQRWRFLAGAVGQRTARPEAAAARPVTGQRHRTFDCLQLGLARAFEPRD